MLEPPLRHLLDFLEDRLDEDKLNFVENLHQDALYWKTVDRLPIIAAYPYPHDTRFQPFPHGQVFNNPEKMLFNQLVNAFDSSIYLSNQVGDDLPISIRADFGCVLAASLFGAQIEQVGDNPPWVRHDQYHIGYEQIIGRSFETMDFKYVDQVTTRYKFYHDVLQNYPRLYKHAILTLPDLQGPFDNLELIRGSDIFTDMIVVQDMFLEAMSAVTDIQIKLINHFQSVIRETRPEFSHQHGYPIKGGVLIRNDTAVMVSPKMYRELIAPFDEKILNLFGGGIHCCGDVNNIVPELLSLVSIECFDFGQSELNNVQTIYNAAKARKVALMRLAVGERDLLEGNLLEKYPTGVSLLFRAQSFEHAKNIVAAYKHAYE
ncbi:MAG: hypothetical protein JW709_01905 [Sedimentisphaerales bacterium]|nr:hypothetical protein [Sedimentisphaerales bacterium]